jgi:hypothetical protein
LNSWETKRLELNRDRIEETGFRTRSLMVVESIEKLFVAEKSRTERECKGGVATI